MNHLQVNDKLSAIIIDDQGTDAATTRLEGVSQFRPKVGLVEDGKGLLDIASLGHSHHYGMLVCMRDELTG
jgi:hypothetical protein